MSVRNDLYRAGLKTLYYSGVHKLLAPYAQGAGLIFTLHRVGRAATRDFAPNDILSVTPAFLDDVLRQVLRAGLDVVTLDEAVARLRSPKPSKRFACFTFDDGYWDNLEYAYPLFRHYGVPFTIYVPSDFPDGQGELWWMALERVIARQPAITISLDGQETTFSTGTEQEKWAAWDHIYWWLRAAQEDVQRATVRDLCRRYDCDPEALCRETIMDWDAIRQLNRDPLVTIGAHTAGHYALAKLSRPRARKELLRGISRLEHELGERPMHLSFPYGDPSSAGTREFDLARSLNFRSAVTTRKGVLFADHAEHLTALPRVSLNGRYQSLQFTDLYMTGVPFAIWNGFKRVDAA